MAFTPTAGNSVNYGGQVFDAGLWVPGVDNWTAENFILSGQGLSPNVGQHLPKVTGLGFTMRNFEIRYISEDRHPSGDPWNHTEGIFLGGCQNCTIEYGYWHHIDNTTALMAFMSTFRWDTGTSRNPANLTFRKCRIGVTGYNGNGLMYDGTNNGFSYGIQGQNGGVPYSNIQFIDCQLGNYTGLPGQSSANGGVGNNGLTGTWTYNGSTANNGILIVQNPDVNGWPPFPDGTQGPPHSFDQGGVVVTNPVPSTVGNVRIF